MGNLIKLIMGLVGMGGGGLGLPVIAGLVASALVALAGFGYVANVKWENFKTALINEGAMKCVSSAKDAELDDLKGRLNAALRQQAAEAERANQLKAENDTIKAESKEGHQQIATATASVQCFIPDTAVDVTNRPLKGGK